MNIYRYWAKASKTEPIDGKQRKFACFGGSNISESDARRDANERLRKLIMRVRSGQQPDRYAYTDRPLREEIVEELQQHNEVVAILTRNIYGAVVLNTPNVLFADIDRSPEYSGQSYEIKLADVIGKIPFLSSSPLVKSLFVSNKDEQHQPTISKIETLCSSFPDLGIRLYKTFNGYRSLVTSHAIDPSSDESRQMLVALDSDPLYVKLCESHQCYRARLTPKPWRCNSPKPPFRFPFDSPEIEAKHRRWLAQYDAAAANYSVCRLIQSFGKQEIEPDIQTIVDLHDAMSVGDLPLA